MKSVSHRAQERLVRGFSNHRRIQMLYLLAKEPELSVAEIAEKLKIIFKTSAAHIQRLAIAGLVLKRNEGSVVRHALSRQGQHILKFLKTIE